MQSFVVDLVRPLTIIRNFPNVKTAHIRSTTVRYVENRSHRAELFAMSIAKPELIGPKEPLKIYYTKTVENKTFTCVLEITQEKALNS
jgi:hypothetical protein